MAFPSTISTFTNPNPTDKLNSPSHSGIETAQNNELMQIEKVIGVEGASSVVGSLEYFIKSPASDGGGHIQGVNKGGTGQTGFAKGDLLVASSSSVLSKQTIGASGLVLTADATQSSGVKWGALGEVKSIIPRPLQIETATLVGHADSVIGYFMLHNITNGITVNKVTVDVNTVTTAGAFKLGLYTEDGQTQITSMIGGSSVAGLVSIPVTSIVLAPGNYYSVCIPVSSKLVLQAWEIGITPPTANLGKITGKESLGGATSIATGNLPTSFNPTTLTSIVAGVVLRLDN